jgi:hypothetical protein
VGAPELAACVVAVTLVPVVQFAAAPVPAEDIFQLAGRLAVAEVPMPLKFSVTVAELGMLICPKADEPVISTKKAASATNDNLFIIFLYVINNSFLNSFRILLELRLTIAGCLKGEQSFTRNLVFDTKLNDIPGVIFWN